MPAGPSNGTSAAAHCRPGHARCCDSTPKRVARSSTCRVWCAPLRCEHGARNQHVGMSSPIVLCLISCSSLIKSIKGLLDYLYSFLCAVHQNGEVFISCGSITATGENGGCPSIFTTAFKAKIYRSRHLDWIMYQSIPLPGLSILYPCATAVAGTVTGDHDTEANMVQSRARERHNNGRS